MISSSSRRTKREKIRQDTSFDESICAVVVQNKRDTYVERFVEDTAFEAEHGRRNASNTPSSEYRPRGNW